MATIPRLGIQRVAPTPEPSEAKPVEAYGVNQRAPFAVAQGLADVAGVVQRERARQDAIRVNEAEVAMTQAVDAALMDERDGILAQQGAKAIEGLDPFRDRLRRALSDAEAGLATDLQRQAFRQRATAYAAAADKRATAYVLGETRRQDAAAHDALMARDQRALGEFARTNDTAGLEATLAAMRQRVRDFGARNGADAAVVAEAETAVVSDGRAAQVLGLLSVGTPDAVAAARKAFVQYGADMTPATREQVTKVVRTGTVNATARAAADRLVGEFPDDERAALAAARKIADTDVSDETVQRIRARFADERRLRDEQRGEFARRLIGLAESGNLESLAPADVQAAKDAGLWSAAQLRARQVRNRVLPETDLAVYDKLFLEMSNEELARVEPAEYRADLSERDYKMLVDRIAMLRQTGGRGDRGLSPAQLTTELLGQARRLNLVDPQATSLAALNKNPTQRARFLRFKDAVEAEMEARRAANGDIPLTGTEARALIGEMLADEVMTTGWFGRDGQVVPRAMAGEAQRELTPEERAARTPARARASLTPAWGETREDYWNRLVRSGVAPDSATAMAMERIQPRTPRLP